MCVPMAYAQIRHLTSVEVSYTTMPAPLWRPLYVAPRQLIRMLLMLRMLLVHASNASCKIFRCCAQCVACALLPGCRGRCGLSRQAGRLACPYMGCGHPSLSHLSMHDPQPMLHANAPCNGTKLEIVSCAHHHVSKQHARGHLWQGAPPCLTPNEYITSSVPAEL